MDGESAVKAAGNAAKGVPDRIACRAAGHGGGDKGAAAGKTTTADKAVAESTNAGAAANVSSTDQTDQVAVILETTHPPAKDTERESVITSVAHDEADTYSEQEVVVVAAEEAAAFSLALSLVVTVAASVAVSEARVATDARAHALLAGASLAAVATSVDALVAAACSHSVGCDACAVGRHAAGTVAVADAKTAASIVPGTCTQLLTLFMAAVRVLEASSPTMAACFWSLWAAVANLLCVAVAVASRVGWVPRPGASVSWPPSLCPSFAGRCA